MADRPRRASGKRGGRRGTGTDTGSGTDTAEHRLCDEIVTPSGSGACMIRCCVLHQLTCDVDVCCSRRGSTPAGRDLAATKNGAFGGLENIILLYHYVSDKELQFPSEATALPSRAASFPAVHG
jgi:hypothetical protein